ncbi:hypothetical protein EYF80_061993 [Liparis tanakae]|uniref:Uncharacterized protein n=1 Tax=Liparis tanakae TaxID=230148 RepID=A0A4Z2EH35_9TELE|nr:hypothetical protein EYF80_061993 [Liparis tanakae]
MDRVLEALVQSDRLHRLLLLGLPIRFQAPPLSFSPTCVSSWSLSERRRPGVGANGFKPVACTRFSGALEPPEGPPEGSSEGLQRIFRGSPEGPPEGLQRGLQRASRGPPEGSSEGPPEGLQRGLQRASRGALGGGVPAARGLTCSWKSRPSGKEQLFAERRTNEWTPQ